MNASMQSHKSSMNAKVCTRHCYKFATNTHIPQPATMQTTGLTSLLLPFMEFYPMVYPSSSSLLTGVPNPLSSLVAFPIQTLVPTRNRIKNSSLQITMPHQMLTSFEAYGLFARLSSTFYFGLQGTHTERSVKNGIKDMCPRESYPNWADAKEHAGEALVLAVDAATKAFACDDALSIDQMTEKIECLRKRCGSPHRPSSYFSEYTLFL